MPSPDSPRSSSSDDLDAATPSRLPSGSHDENYNQRRPSFNAVNQRPLPNPIVRPGSSHSGQMLAAILRDRPLPLPTNEQTAEERRRSIIAMDRKRRLTSAYEDGRRRTNSGSFYDRRTTYEGYRQDGPSSPVWNHTNASRSVPNVVDLTSSSPPAPPPAPAPPPPPPRENVMSRSSSDNSRRPTLKSTNVPFASALSPGCSDGITAENVGELSAMIALPTALPFLDNSLSIHLDHRSYSRAMGLEAAMIL
ncbi:hypothetical protein LTS15_008926 [Exophiala xenobiotica]|nr:hypothetical protein LTS15_008926 [Exophiala xenobiotica]